MRAVVLVATFGLEVVAPVIVVVVVLIVGALLVVVIVVVERCWLLLLLRRARWLLGFWLGLLFGCWGAAGCSILVVQTW